MFEARTKHVLRWEKFDDRGSSGLELTVSERLVDELFCCFGVQVFLFDDLVKFYLLLFSDELAPVAFHIGIVVDGVDELFNEVFLAT